MHWIFRASIDLPPALPRGDSGFLRWPLGLRFDEQAFNAAAVCGENRNLGTIR
jgi:hypothetical protein